MKSKYYEQVYAKPLYNLNEMDKLLENKTTDTDSRKKERRKYEQSVINKEIKLITNFPQTKAQDKGFTSKFYKI